MRCGITNRSVPADEFEHDFRKLLNLLTVGPKAHELMLALAIQADKARRGVTTSEDECEKQTQEALALCHRRIDAAVDLYKDGEIDQTEYLRIREQNEREIAHWETRTSETEKLALELGLSVEALEKVSRLWDISDDEDRRGLAHSLFESITYDLDEQQIVDFRLKP